MSDGVVSFDWSSPINSGDTPFPADTLNRKKYAEFLHNYLVSNAASGGYVLNLNAKWGAGKTYFINRWIDSIKDTHPVVYVDAWKQDYSDDPMLTVVSSLLNALSSHLPKENQHVANISEKSARFIKALAPALMKGVVKKATGVNLDDITFEEETTQKDDEQKDSSVTDIMAESASIVAKCMIDEHNDKLEAVMHLRNEIKQLVEAVTAYRDNQLQAPAFVFIDELDRCRPSYAVEMLEVVKHFFELDNIVFVIATDTEQLQHAVKAVYGEGFDAQTYLGRFFRRRYSLTELSRYDFVQQIVESRVTYDPGWSEHVPSIDGLSNLANVISIVADRFRLSLRDTEQLADKFVAVLSNTNKTMNPYLLLILFVLRDKYHDLYVKWVEAKKDAKFHSDIVEFINYEVGNFILSYKSMEGEFLPIVSNSQNTQAVNVNLHQILDQMNTYCMPWIQKDKDDYLTSLDESSKQNNNHRFKVGNYLKSCWVNLAATKTDYKNWVELAVSFDD
ncbi:KAP family NTPase [Vibrio alginolyticus]|uniref:KAP family P-loop NTPase fold protein n=1 Tax=Vibrio TaxID=662 RepID=UPI00076A275E|nr:KAP family NTPase [Vibrio splendidus]MCG9603534.1 KAP family NTPase [Vibrio chagasii]MDE9382498.1 KAP family NTPase [Vibrio alginolyticus]